MGNCVLAFIVIDTDYVDSYVVPFSECFFFYHFGLDSSNRHLNINRKYVMRLKSKLRHFANRYSIEFLEQ